MSQLRFDGQVIIVTGAGRGLGRAYARLLAARGAIVVVNDLGAELAGAGQSADPAQDTVAELVAAGAVAIADHGSVADEDAMQALVARVLDRFGRIDAIVNNAGTRRIGSLLEASNADVRSLLDVSLFGTLNLTRAAWPALRASRGRVVNTVSSSLFGLREYNGYAAAKGAVFGLTRSLAIEAGEQGIAVNAVAPAAVTRFMRSGGAASAILDWAERALDPALVAPIVAFLAHADCRLNGAVLGGGGGQVGAWLFGETAGIVDRALTPEAIAANIARICDPADWQGYAATSDQGRRMQPVVSAAMA